MPAQDPNKYAVPSTWGASPYHDLVLPSGHTILAKRLDLAGIVAADMLDEFDKLSPTVEEKVVKPAKGAGRKPSDRPAKKLTKAQQKAADEKAVLDFFKGGEMAVLVSLLNRVIPQIVAQPRVLSPVAKSEDGTWVEISPAERVEGAVYVDTIPLGDQMTILEFGMEGMDMDGLQSFREQSEPDVVDVAVVPVRQDPPV